MRIIQISDSHISAEHDHFAANTDAIACSLAEQKPDLFVHTGDLSMDGARKPDELAISRQWYEGLSSEVLAIPGNHDVGDAATVRPDQPVDDARLSRWHDAIGPDRWERIEAGWHLVGLNAMLFGTGHEEEDEQFKWLASVLTRSRPIAIFVHKPICIDAPLEGPRGYWTVAQTPRARLLEVLKDRPVKLIASGHLHIERQRRIDGISHVWGPACSFVCGAMQEDLGGNRRLGYVEHVFGVDDVRSRFIRPGGVKDLELDPVRGEIYR